MPDVVVTLPKRFTWSGAPGRTGLAAWLMEGDPAGEERSGEEYAFSIGKRRPRIEPGERVYIVHDGRLIGYAPLLRLDSCSPWRCALVRGGGAIAVTIDEPISGFRGWRYRWWNRSLERSIVNWPDIVAAARANTPLPPIRTEAIAS